MKVEKCFIGRRVQVCTNSSASLAGDVVPSALMFHFFVTWALIPTSGQLSNLVSLARGKYGYKGCRMMCICGLCIGITQKKARLLANTLMRVQND